MPGSQPPGTRGHRMGVQIQVFPSLQGVLLWEIPCERVTVRMNVRATASAMVPLRPGASVQCTPCPATQQGREEGAGTQGEEDSVVNGKEAGRGPGGVSQQRVPSPWAWRKESQGGWCRGSKAGLAGPVQSMSCEGGRSPGRVLAGVT